MPVLCFLVSFKNSGSYAGLTNKHFGWNCYSVRHHLGVTVTSVRPSAGEEVPVEPFAWPAWPGLWALFGDPTLYLPTDGSPPDLDISCSK